MVPKLPARDRNLVGREPNHSRSPLSKPGRMRQYDSAAANEPGVILFHIANEIHRPRSCSRVTVREITLQRCAR